MPPRLIASRPPRFRGGQLGSSPTVAQDRTLGVPVTGAKTAHPARPARVHVPEPENNVKPKRPPVYSRRIHMADVGLTSRSAPRRRASEHEAERLALAKGRWS